MRRRYFPEGNDDSGQPYSDMRWSHFKNFAPQRMFDVVDNRIFLIRPNFVNGFRQV